MSRGVEYMPPGVGFLNGEFVNVTGDTMTGDLTMNGGNIVMTGTETVDGIDISAFIDQDVSSGSTPTLTGTNFTGIPDSALDLDYVEVTGDTMIGTNSTTFFQIQQADTSVVLNVDTTNGRVGIDELRALSANGLKLYEDGGKGIFVQDSSGNVGVGTTSPRSLLELRGVPEITLDREGTWSSRASGLKLLTDSTPSHFWTVGMQPVSTNDFYIQYDTSKHFTVKTTGNVGIGTTGPSSALDIANSTNALRLRAGDGTGADGDKQIKFSWDGGVNYTHTIRTRHNGSGDVGNAIDFYVWDYGTDAVGADGTNLVMSLNGGNVGIGTTGPTAKLDINSNILRLRTAKTPASAGAAGNVGDICWDANFIYVAVATNTWKKASIATW